MQNVALRGLPDELHAWLKDEADRTSRSLNGQIIHLLGEARATAVRRAEREARLEAFRAHYLAEADFDLDAVLSGIREDRGGH